MSVEQVVVGSLDGYNGTVFAYGQTGSGKTYTITGGAERYVDRGIIPRAISLIFGEVAERSEYTYTLHFSYLEIYNETGYDLLNPDHETKRLEDLPKVGLSHSDHFSVCLLVWCQKFTVLPLICQKSRPLPPLSHNRTRAHGSISCSQQFHVLSLYSQWSQYVDFFDICKLSELPLVLHL